MAWNNKRIHFSKRVADESRLTRNVTINRQNTLDNVSAYIYHNKRIHFSKRVVDESRLTRNVTINRQNTLDNVSAYIYLHRLKPDISFSMNAFDTWSTLSFRQTSRLLCIVRLNKMYLESYKCISYSMHCKLILKRIFWYGWNWLFKLFPLILHT